MMITDSRERLERIAEILSKGIVRMCEKRIRKCDHESVVNICVIYFDMEATIL